MTKTPYIPLTHEQLKQFSGLNAPYRHGLDPRVIYTEGVQFLAERAGAYWLLDVIVSYLTPRFVEEAAQVDERIRFLQFWWLEVAPDRSAVVTARADYKVGTPFVTHKIDFTDFPLESADIWAGYDGARWRLFLSSED